MNTSSNGSPAQKNTKVLSLIKFAMIVSAVFIPALVYFVTQESLILLAIPFLGITDYVAYGIIKKNMIRQGIVEDAEEEKQFK